MDDFHYDNDYLYDFRNGTTNMYDVIIEFMNLVIYDITKKKNITVHNIDLLGDSIKNISIQ